MTTNMKIENLEWRISSDLVPYPEALAEMEQRVAQIHAGDAPELIWLLEHPPLYTAGTSTNKEDLLDARFPVFEAGRGGELTYHGPGQRVIYILMDLNKRGRDVRKFVHNLEQWMIDTLAQFNIVGEVRDDRVGVWVVRDGGMEDKIGAIGVRVRKWVTFHGIALNVEPDLTHYSGIVPCGIRGFGVTSLVDLGTPATMSDVDVAFKETFANVFGND